MPLASLAAHPRNYRRHPDEQVARLAASLARFGQVRSIVVQAGAPGRYLTVAGHGVVTAARESGWSDVAADIIPADWTAEQVEGYLVADNEHARGADDDLVALAALLEGQQHAGHALETLGYDDDALAALLEELADAHLAGGGDRRDVDDPDGGGDDFDATPDEGPTRTRPGDLWQLGAHRLLCGDSTKREDVARLLGEAMPLLMVTDPPYGVEYDAAWRDEAAAAGLISPAARRVAPVRNDDRVDWREAWALFPGDVAYCWHAYLGASDVHGSLSAAGFEVRCQIIWAKSRFVISRGHYHAQHEACWYAVRKGATAHWTGDHSQTTLWAINLDRNVEGGHSTQKPILCMAKPMMNHGAHEDAVYDPFLGSGTTLIAAERLGRRCYGMEIEPRYCDIILRRWETETGREAVRLGGDDGQD